MKIIKTIAVVSSFFPLACYVLIGFLMERYVKAEYNQETYLTLLEAVNVVKIVPITLGMIIVLTCAVILFFLDWKESNLRKSSL